jgi:GxxExxY protein
MVLQEAMYQGTLQIELRQRNIPFQREQSVPVLYKGVALGAPLVLPWCSLGAPYRANFVCCGSVLFELKAIKSLTDVESAQVLHYLKATGFGRAPFSNFATPRLDCKRFIQSGNRLRKSASSAVHQQSARAAGGRSVFRRFVCPPSRRRAIDRGGRAGGGAIQDSWPRRFRHFPGFCEQWKTE